MPRISTVRAVQLALPDRLGRADDARQQVARDAEQREQLVVPVERLEVDEQRPRRVRHVDHVLLAAGQPPDEEAVDGAEREPVARAVLAQQPLELRRREVRVGHEPRLARGSAPASSSRQRSAVRRSCHTIAGATGFPVARSQSSVVSRWFVIATDVGLAAELRARPRR